MPLVVVVLVITCVSFVMGMYVMASLVSPAMQEAEAELAELRRQLGEVSADLSSTVQWSDSVVDPRLSSSFYQPEVAR